MKTKLSLLPAGMAALFATAVFAQGASQPVVKTLSPDARAHIAAARKLAGDDLPKSTIGELFNTVRGLADNAILPPADHPMGGPFVPLEPTKVFDQLYFIGGAFVGVWVLNTNNGIIMWDAMDNDDEAEHVIEPGFRKLGLDPAKIKYIVITHGHGDHYGGVNYFKKKYPGLRIYASPADWDLMARTGARVAALPSTQALHFAPPPARDVDVSDGQKLTLGNTTVTLYVTPGHTPGPVSAVFHVTDHGQPHTVALFGGFGIPSEIKPGSNDAGIDVFDRELVKFEKTAEAAGTDVALSTHPGFDGTEANIPKLKARKPDDPNPWVIGRDGYTRLMNEVLEISHAKRDIVLQHERTATN